MEDAKPIGGDFEKLGEHLFTVTIGVELEIGEFRECTGLSVEREILEYTEGGNNDFVHKLPGRVKFPNLVLKRGVTDQKKLLKWFWATRSNPELTIVTLTLVDPTGTDARVWTFENAYPVKWAGPNLNAGSDSAATETLEIAHGGFSGGMVEG
jgi:phage tail-like protein